MPRASQKRPDKPVYLSIGVNPGVFARFRSFAQMHRIPNTTFIEILVTAWEGMSESQRADAIAASAEVKSLRVRNKSA